MEVQSQWEPWDHGELGTGVPAMYVLGCPQGRPGAGLPTISGKQNLNAGCSLERGTLDGAALAGQPRLLPGGLHSIT